MAERSGFERAEATRSGLDDFDGGRTRDGRSEGDRSGAGRFRGGRSGGERGASDQQVLDGVVADMVSVAWAEHFARAMAPLRESTADRSRAVLPEEARLLDLLGLDLLTPAKLADRWATAPESRRIMLGAGPSGSVEVDLDTVMAPADLLVAGMPGSGVTELLTAAVSGLAAGNRPDRLTLLTVGLPGAGNLPHTAVALPDPPLPGAGGALGGALGGVVGAAGVTAADALSFGAGPDEVALFLERLRAELTARQDEFGVSDTAAPRLVIAIDRVQQWAVAAPLLLAELTALLLGGARPAGVHVLLGVTLDGDSGTDPLDLELCATAAVRVALHVPDAASSRRILGAGGAELLDDLGRGYVRLHDGSVVPFRGARISGRMPSTNTLRASVQRQSWRDLGSPRTRHASAPGGPTDFALLAGTLNRTAGQLRSR